MISIALTCLLILPLSANQEIDGKGKHIGQPAQPSSQPPAPAPTETGQHAKQRADDGGRQANGKSVVGQSSPVTAEGYGRSDTTNPPGGKAGTDNQGSSAQWWFNCLLVIFTGSLAILAGFQLAAMHKQAEYMRQQAVLMQDALEETAKAADAAKRSADTAKLTFESGAASTQQQLDLMSGQLAEMKTTSADTHSLALVANDAAELFRSDQRARLAVQGGYGGKHVNIGPETKAYGGIIYGTLVHIDIVIANIGKTPANDVMLCSGIQYAHVNGSSPRTFSAHAMFEEDCQQLAVALSGFSKGDVWAKFAERGGEGFLPVTLKNLGVINPGDRPRVTIGWFGTKDAEPPGLGRDHLKPDELLAIGQQIACLLVSARLKYTDIFGKMHNTLYCARWQPPSDELMAWPYGNYAD